MAETETEEETEQVTRAWASQTPETRIRGTPTEIIFAGDISETQNGSSFGLVLEDPELVSGSVWSNQVRGEGETTADATDEDQPRPTDFRIADTDDGSTTIANGALVTGENGPNTYDEVDGFDVDEVLIWYNGMSGQRVSRVLDFNGRPFARHTDDGYVVKGLFQAAERWRGADGDTRSTMADNGLAPRVARFPVLRDDVDEVLLDVSRYRGGRGYELHVFDADEFEDEFGSADHPLSEIERNDYYQLEADSELEMQYREDADDVLDEVAEDVDSTDVRTADDLMVLEYGPEWEDETHEGTTGSFSVSTSSAADDSDSDPTSAESEWDQFAGILADELPDGMTPDETFEGGLEGQIRQNEDRFTTVPDTKSIRERIYAQVAWLDVDDLD